MLYCEEKDCSKKENCLRYVRLQDFRKEFPNIEAKGFENGLWLTDVKECNTNIEFFYKTIKSSKICGI